MKQSIRGVATAALLASATVCSAQVGSLRAGAAKADITHTKDMFPLKASQTHGGAHDPLYARALVVDNGTSKIAMISVDATDVHYGDELIQAVTRELKIPAQNLILNATHDHNSPMAGREGHRDPRTSKSSRRASSKPPARPTRISSLHGSATAPARPMSTPIATRNSGPAITWATRPRDHPIKP